MLPTHQVYGPRQKDRRPIAILVLCCVILFVLVDPIPEMWGSRCKDSHTKLRSARQVTGNYNSIFSSEPRRTVTIQVMSTLHGYHRVYHSPYYLNYLVRRCSVPCRIISQTWETPKRSGENVRVAEEDPKSGQAIDGHNDRIVDEKDSRNSSINHASDVAKARMFTQRNGSNIWLSPLTQQLRMLPSEEADVLLYSSVDVREKITTGEEISSLPGQKLAVIEIKKDAGDEGILQKEKGGFKPDALIGWKSGAIPLTFANDVWKDVWDFQDAVEIVQRTPLQENSLEKQRAAKKTQEQNDNDLDDLAKMEDTEVQADASSQIEHFNIGKPVTVFFLPDCSYIRPRDIAYLTELIETLNAPSYGKCLRNREPSDDAPVNAKKQKLIGRELDQYLMGTGYFVVVWEPLPDAIGLVTEDFYLALGSHAVPVYMGPPDAANFFPGNDAVILMRQYVAQQPSQLANHLIQTAEDTFSYQKHTLWRGKALHPQFVKLFTKGLEDTVCSLCNWASKELTYP